ncbi:MAG: CRISPR-associated endoribonuclease Cas6 [Eubacteriales bacterium]|nr:CRISPR-associated endoribonuclease Cas6 [Eubacteriales bacterium]
MRIALTELTLSGSEEMGELPPLLLGRALHALLFAGLKRCRPDLADRFHAADPRPFSLKFRGRDRVAVVSFHPELNEALKEVLAESLKGEVKGKEFAAKVAEGKEKEDLFLSLFAAPLEEITLQVVTPAAFKTGDFFLPLPVPRLIVENLLRRWNAWLEPAIPEEFLTWVERNLYLTRCKVNTTKTGAEGVLVGFTGSFTLRVKNAEAKENCYLSTLLRFAALAGIGVKTAMGMGSVEIATEKRVEDRWGQGKR